MPLLVWNKFRFLKKGIVCEYFDIKNKRNGINKPWVKKDIFCSKITGEGCTLLLLFTICCFFTFFVSYKCIYSFYNLIFKFSFKCFILFVNLLSKFSFCLFVCFLFCFFSFLFTCYFYFALFLSYFFVLVTLFSFGVSFSFFSNYLFSFILYCYEIAIFNLEFSWN